MQPEKITWWDMSNYQEWRAWADRCVWCISCERTWNRDHRLHEYSCSLHKRSRNSRSVYWKICPYHGRKYDVTVATSDGLEQIIIRGQGCRLLSARELKRDYEEAKAQIRTEYLERIRKWENLYDGWNILGERTAREGKLIIQKWRR